jgi:ABC-type enterobactin transport system permease subunit
VYLAWIADVEPQVAPNILVETAFPLAVQSAMVATVKLAQADLLEQVGLEQFLLPTVVAGGRCSDHLDL